MHRHIVILYLIGSIAIANLGCEHINDDAKPPRSPPNAPPLLSQEPDNGPRRSNHDFVHETELTLQLTQPKATALGAEVALGVRAELQSPATLRYALEVIKANEEVPVWLFESENIEIATLTKGRTNRLPDTVTLPPLKGGYYFIRATMVATDQKKDASEQATLYLVVEGQTVSAIDTIEWFDRSGEMNATPFHSDATETTP